MKIKHIALKTEDELELPGLLYEPDLGSNKAIIYLHGNGGGSAFYSIEKMNGFAKAFTDIGYSFLAFNNRGAYQYHTLKKVETLETQNSKQSGEVRKEYVKAGTAFEVIKECVLDIDASLECLKSLGYLEFILMGHSTGANKICVYDHYKPENIFSKYIILSGGDDTGMYFTSLGGWKFSQLLKKSRSMVEKGRGNEFAPWKYMNNIYSYKGIFDILNPDGDYNCFPYNEYIDPKLKLSTRELFDYFKRITKPTLVIYGEFDEYLPFTGIEALEILKKQIDNKSHFTFELIEGADHGFEKKEEKLAEFIIQMLNK